MSLPTPTFAFGVKSSFYTRIPTGLRRIRNRIHDSKVTTYDVRWEMLDDTEFSALLAEFDNSGGGAGRTSLTLPTSMGGATVSASFVGSLSVTRVNYKLWNASATMEVHRA